MYEFEKVYQDFTNEHSQMKVAIVTAIKTNKDWSDYFRRNSCFLYDDILAQEFGPKKFAEIILIKTDPKYRRLGYGSKLIEEFIKNNPNLPIFLRAGVLTEKKYNELESKGELINYIYDNIVPFYEHAGFIDVNNTSLAYQSAVIMCYPKNLAQKYIDEAKKFEERKKSILCK